jgi:hypothetical protein
MDPQNPTTGATPAGQWKTNIRPEGTALPLPSGNTALVRNISPQAFLASGIIPNPLMNIIRKAINEAEGLPPGKLKKMMGDDTMLVASLELFDRMLCYVLVDPPAKMPPTCRHCGEYSKPNDQHNDSSHENYHRYVEADRDPNVLYADIVEMDDKVFIAQWCLGGTSDLEQFRQQSEDGLASVLGREDVPVSSE